MICRKCDWYDTTITEDGFEDYCIRRDIQGSIIENMIECYYFEDVFEKGREGLIE